jgi:hypothetical protein
MRSKTAEIRLDVSNVGGITFSKCLKAALNNF